MKRRTYLEGILTVNAILLAGVIWVLASGGVAATSTAIADDSPPRGIPNAAAQRQQMIRELAALSDSVRGLRSDLKEAAFDVRVTSIPPVTVKNNGNESK